MIKLLQFKLLVFLLLFFPLFSFSQGLDHPLGEILFQLDHQSSIDSFANTIQQDYPKHLNSSNIEQISEPFDIWKITFNPNVINEINLLEDLIRYPEIVNAQFNYFTSERTEPDDPNFSNLWHLKNIGQSGGISGADIDATLAWEQTTGGLTILGDTVVICIIDERFDLLHEDLATNIWINHAEIPDNGIDDDNNGYIDDYYGWNINSNNDDISNIGDNDWHGTAVAGVAGAVGNNGIGITGVAWNIKMMLVTRGNTIADAVTAYTYPFENRKKYNESQGQEGAFVVATNTSWGVDYGSPSIAPLWCAIYDSLGSVGILNAAATINANANVDVVGDLPTTCGSDFLITTTSVDHNDLKVNNAGYGAEHIDLAAFGENIHTTLNNNAYGAVTGTSAATPQITAAIGLLHTLPCPSFAASAISSPQQAALQIKQYLLEGTDPNVSLQGLTVSGGRLNLYNSFNLLMDECNYSGCYGPYEITVSEIGTASVTIDWITDASTSSLNMRFRKTGTSTWTILENAQSPATLYSLDACSDYEAQIQPICGNITGSYSNSILFQTDGCCNAPSFIEFEAMTNSIMLDWEAITAAVSYELRYRETGAVDWMIANFSNNSGLITDLEDCQAYEFQIKTICQGIQSLYSPIYNYTTLGCGACLENVYCPSSGPVGSLSWIDSLSLADLNHVSGNSGTGYSDFTDQSATLIQGFVHEINISTDYDLIQLLAIFSVWIDLNQDGIFEDSERLLHSENPESSTSGILYIPQNALLGSTRMRVSFMPGSSPCQLSNIGGEVEDYCIYITEPIECLPPVNFDIEVSDHSLDLTWSGNSLVDEYLLRYRELGTLIWNTTTVSTNYFSIENLSACTDYEYCLTSICDGETSMSSPLFVARTKGCGTCLDEDYCLITNNNTDFEWIDYFILNDLENVSGSNNGFAHFPEYTTDLIIGESYPIEIKPGFASTKYLEVFSAWIDFNQDGVFDQWSEKVFDEVSLDGATVSDIIDIPSTALTGSTRIRVSMKYGDFTSSPCEHNFFGETEEYCINIYDLQSDGCGIPVLNFHEPLDSISVVLDWLPVQNANAYQVRYRPSLDTSSQWNYITTANEFVVLSPLSSCKDFDVQLQAICETGISGFGTTYIINPCQSSVAVQDIESVHLPITISPNPFSENINLSMATDAIETVKVEIFNSLGQSVKHFHLETMPDKNNFELDLQNLQSGVYFLSVFKNGEVIASERMIKM